MPLSELFQRRYEGAIRMGLVAVVWFAACARAAHDLWAASVVFLWATALACVFCVGRLLDKKPVKLPLLAPCLLFLAGIALSGPHSFDRNTTTLEIWIWVFCFVLALLFVNAFETREDLELFSAASSAALIPLAVLLLSRVQLGVSLDERLIASTFWRHVAIVAFFSAVFCGVMLFFVRVLERRTGKDSLLAFSAFACIAAALLVFTRGDIDELNNPLINHNVLVGFMLYWFYFLWKKIFERGAYLLLFLPAFLILTEARSWWSYVAILAGLLFYYRVALRKMIAGHKAAFLSAAGAAAGVLLALVILKARQHTQIIQGANRLYWWASAARMFLAHPWAGVGAGGFAAAYPYFKGGAAQGTLHAHSFPLQLLAETGAAGVVPAVFLCWAYRRLLSQHEEGEMDQRVFQGTLTCILCFAAIQINLEYFLNKFLFLILLGSAFVGRKLPASRVKPLWLAAAPVCLLLMVPFWLALWISDRLYISARNHQEQGNAAKAEELYKSALSIDPANAECYWALSRLSLEKYRVTGSAQARTESWDYLREGLRYKKELRYFEEEQAARLALQAR